MKGFRGVLAFLTLALAVGTPGLAHAQGLSGQIGGSVVDNSKGAVPGATVTVRNTATAVTRDVVTDSTGLFVFTNLFAGTYDLRVTLTGFRTYEQKGLVLSATERLAVPPITLEVGGLEEVVTVEASALHAQAQSGERSGTIRADEIKDTQLRGRDFLGLLQGMPGVVDTNVRNAPGWNSFLGTQINGLSDQLMGMSYDGVSSKDTGFGAANYVTPSLDAIAEVKVQTSNYQAEYGRAGGANIIIVTKSGSSRFSGSAAYFKRHEALTSNSWDRRRACDASGGTTALCEKARYRYDNSAATLGGPVLIPGTTFNEKRDKLFFFYSLDYLPRTDPFLVSSTMPSALERNGDFSQTRNNAGVLRNAPFADITIGDWDAVIDTHLGGTMLCTRAALPDLVSTRGAVVNISSGAVRGSNRGHAGYSAAKAALVGLTRTLAIELGPLGVRVNAVAPGATDSEMTRLTAAELGIDFATYVEEQSARIPLRRIGRPVDVANVVCVLVSDLSAYITGETVFVAVGPVGGV